MRKAAILILLILFFAGYALSAARMESLRDGGTDVLLALAPVDPRALLMGDYMTLEYTVNNAIRSALRARNAADTGRAVLRLEPVAAPAGGAVGGDVSPYRAGVFVRLDDGGPLAENEVFLQFKVRDRGVISAATAFYFEEGRAAAYERARYGRLKMGGGKTLLMTLCDDRGMDIMPTKEQ